MSKATEKIKEIATKVNTATKKIETVLFGPEAAYTKEAKAKEAEDWENLKKEAESEIENDEYLDANGNPIGEQPTFEELLKGEGPKIPIEINDENEKY